MLGQYRLGEYIVEIDISATHDWYAKDEGWSCSCGHCRNFLVLAVARKLPSPYISLLDSLGIPPEKATYVCMEYKDGQKRLLYDFSYRICGRVLQGDQNNRGAIACFHEKYPYGAPSFPESHFDLGFWDWLPWVLEEEE